MRSIRNWFASSLAVAVWASSLPAQAESAGSTTAQEETRRPIVAVVGASVSAGFIDPAPRADGERNSTVKLVRALGPYFGEPEPELRDQSDLLLFLAPGESAKRQLERTADAKPELVLAVDLPFWFGYGRVDGTEARLRLQAELFTLLETLFAKHGAPIVLGDYPDMRGADPRMLPRASVPSVEELAELNRRLRSWAARHPNVVLFPLADFVAAARGDGAELLFEGETVRLGSALLMQGDRLHATRSGMAVLAQRLAQALSTGLPAAHPLRREAPAFEVFARHVGADSEIEDWLDTAAATASGGKRR